MMIPLLLGISLVSFLVMHLAPGDPTSLFINPNVSMEEIARVRANWGLDKPILVQYFYWLKNAIRLDFGSSYITGRPVIAEILERLPATLILMFSSLLFSLVIAIPIGVLSALHKNSFFDKLTTFLSFLFMSVPSFWLGLILILFFSIYLRLFPSIGMYSLGMREANILTRFLDLLWHLALPVLTMSLVSVAGLSRYQRATMMEVLKRDFIRTAYAKGIPEKVIIFKHALKNALLPLITILGLSLSNLFGGAFIIETIFAWPGMGRLGVQSAFQRNYPLVMGIVVFSAFLIILGNLLADIAYAIVDPRIHYEKKH